MNKQVELKDLAISDSGLVFDPATGTICTSNPTGIRVIRALLEKKTLDEIAGMLVAEYGESPKTIEKDLRDFLTQLKAYGCLD